MKKILFVIAAVLVAAIAALGIFIATFDVNLYKGLLISQLESMTGNQVEIGRLSLEWRGKVVLGIEDFKVYENRPAGRIILLSFERADASVESAPLLIRRLYFSSVSVRRPNVHIVRMKDARIEVSGLLKKPSPKPEASPVAVPRDTPAQAFGFDVGSVEIKDGTVRFQDIMSDPASDIMVRKIDAEIKNISTAGPIKFTAKMAFAGARQNVTVSGSVGGFRSGVPYLKDFDIWMDLGAFDHTELMNAFPALQKIGLKAGLAGVVKARIREFELTKNEVSKLSADILIEGGRLVMRQLKAPVENVNLSLSAEGKSFTVKFFSARLANGSLGGSARFDDIFASPRTTLHVKAEVQGVKSFVFSVLEQKQNMDGNMRLTFDGTMTGVSWPEISRTLSGGGEFYLDRGVMTDTNVLNQSISSLTLFPGLPEMVRGYVPEPIRQAFGENNTVIKPLNQSYTIEGGYVMIPDFKLGTDLFDMRGEAKTSLTGDVSGSGIIRFTQSISSAMIMAVPEMRYIADSEGRVEFPMAFKGGENGFKVIPDLKYVGQKVAVQKAGEVVTDLIMKKISDGAKPQSEGSAGSSGKPPKLKDIMKSLLEEQRK